MERLDSDGMKMEERQMDGGVTDNNGRRQKD